MANLHHAKLTKTEAKILEHASRRYGTYGASHQIGLTPRGAKIDYGSLEYRACLSLIRKGYATKLSQNFSRESRNGYSVSVFDIAIKLVEA